MHEKKQKGNQEVEFQKINQTSRIPSVNLALDTIKKDKQALIFVNSKRGAERNAEDIALKIKIQKTEWDELSEKALKVLSRPTKQCKRLALCLKHGVAFHHSGLHQKQKELIENAFRNTTIKIISCTPTLAAGVDLPAYRTIIRDAKRYSGSWGMKYIPVLEYMQMAGRAGRPGKETEGQAILLASTDSDKDQLYERFIMGEPEDITSKLAVEPVLRTYVLSLVSSRLVDSKKRLLEFFSKTFWAHQYEDIDKLSYIMTKVLNLLSDFEFIRMQNDDDFQSADSLNDTGKISPTVLGQRVAQLYLDPLTAHELMEGLKRVNTKHTEPFSLLHLVCSTLEMRPHLNIKTREYEDIQEKLVRYEDFLLVKIPSMFDPEYDQFLKTIKTALFMRDWIEEKDEEELLETFDIRPGEIHAKLNNADWLFYACEELARLMSFRDLQKEINRTRIRVKYGVKEELLYLLKLKNIGRVRARKLFNNGMKTIADIRRTNITTLSALLGPTVARNLKEQLGERIDPIKTGKRKGQLSVKKFVKKSQ